MKRKTDLPMSQLIDQVRILEIGSVIENFGIIKEWAEKCWLDLGAPSDKMEKMLLAIEEAFANICFHGYKSKLGSVKLECLSENNDSIVYRITDWADLFDVTRVAAPDITLGLSERSVGGLGVLLIREMANEINWRSDNGANVLSLKFNIS